MSSPVMADFGDPNDPSSDEYFPSNIESDDTDCTYMENVENVIDNQNESQELEEAIPKKRGRKKTIEGLERRKRKREPKSWTREIRKKNLNEGKEYQSVKGKTVQAKSLKPACRCRSKCYERFSELERETLFADYYSMKKEAKNQFIAGLVNEKEKSRQRVRDGRVLESRRKFTRQYFLPKSGEHILICQQMFLNTLDLTVKKVRVVVMKKRRSTSGVCLDDQRGKHGNQPKTSAEARKIILDHIKMFPAFESHYSRSHTSKKYLSSELSISKMFRLYTDHCKEKNIQPESEYYYRQMFVQNFNYQFKKPKNDTCAKCDKLEMIKRSTENEEEKLKADDLKTKHLDLAETAYNQKKCDKNLSLKEKGLAVISFDLQKCLATPYLVNGVSFYKRQLWTFNLTLYETKEPNSTSKMCFMWDETMANRGSQEIASCLYKYLNNLLDNGIKEVIFYSDCCPGQNRNIYVSAMLLYVVRKRQEAGQPIIIHHKFLEPGHTHMEADTIHALIEKAKKKTVTPIEIPRDWSAFIKYIDCDPKLIVFEMVQEEFLDFKSLMKTDFIHRTENTLGEPVIWNNIRWLKYEYNEESPDQILYKTSLLTNEAFKVLDIRRKRARRGKKSSLNNQAQDRHELQPIASKPLPISQEKLKDLKSLMPFISNNGKIYYDTFMNALTSSSAVEDLTDDDLDYEEN